MITGCLQQKNGFYYAVLYLKVNGRRRCKWVPMRLPVEGTSARKAQKAFDEIRLQYEREEEERLEREAKAKELAENTHPDALLPFTEYMEKWLQSTRSSLATATYQSYSNMIKARIRPYFTPLGLQLREVTPQHIEEFYQSILADDCTTNTVIHYHAIIRKALQTAVKKDILLKNPADKVDRPKKNVFHGSFYSEEEMLTLFDAVSGDPLELCVKIAAYYGLRRSEVLGLRWSAIDMEHKTISISHKVIEAEVDGKFVPMGEDVLKTKSSFRTLPLIPAVGIILLEEKEKQEMYRRLFKKSYCRDYLDYICVDQCGKLLRPNYVTEHFSWLIEKYGLRKVRFHDLRHTFATLALQNGMDVKTLSAMLGHVSAATTLDIYTHITDDMRLTAAANIDRGIGKAAPKEDSSEPREETAPVTAEKPRMTDFKPYVGRKRKSGTGCISEINDHLFEGRYSPKWPDGKKHARNVYARTREECEEKLKVLIVEMKEEIAEMQRLKAEGTLPPRESEKSQKKTKKSKKNK